MAKKKRIKDTLNANPLAENVHIEGAGNIKDEKIVDTLVTNYMPYAMSVILSRAIPEIDGFKPSQCIIWAFCKAELSRAQILSAEQCNSTLTVTHLYMKQ